MPLIVFSRVVLPAPFGPMMPRRSPRSTSRLTPRSAATPPEAMAGCLPKATPSQSRIPRTLRPGNVRVTSPSSITSSSNDRLAHRDELLGRRRVDADGRIELRLRRAALECHGESLDDLRRLRADHVAAEDLVG